MGRLTPKQEEFAVEFVRGGGKNGSAAYRRAYDTSRMSDAAVNVEASRLLKNPKVALRIAELRKPVADAAQLTLAAHLRKLAEIRDIALKAGQCSAAIQAEFYRGRAAGLYVDRKKLSIDATAVLSLSADDLDALADQLERMAPIH